MPRRRLEHGPPKDYVDGDFLLDRLQDFSPPGVFEMREVARNLAAVIEDSGATISAVAELAGVDRSVIYDVLAGRSYLNAVTLARLERAVDEQLWVRYHDG